MSKHTPRKADGLGVPAGACPDHDERDFCTCIKASYRANRKRKARRGKLDRRRIESASWGSEVGMWYQQDGKSVPDLRGTFIQGAEWAKAHYDEMIERGELVFAKPH